MKSKSTFLTITVGLLFLCMTLPPLDCNPPTGNAILDVNNVIAHLRVGGSLWNDEGNAGYVIPKPPGPGLPEVKAIYAGGLWMGAFDPGGELKVAAETYGYTNSVSDYFAGPLDENGITDVGICPYFDQLWSMTKTDIDAHKADFADNGMIDGPVAENVLAWPGRLNPEFENTNGFPLPDYGYGYAPFFDQNANGVYEPFAGDYPHINDADQGEWSVFNDNGAAHSSSNGNALKMEIHLLAYSYISSEDAINNATFYDYKFINKGDQYLDSLHLGLWVDPSLGCFNDDYLGCSPEHNMAYVYNMDDRDGDTNCSCPAGVNTYCDEIPVVGFKVLKGPKAARNFNDLGELVIPPIGSIGDTLIELGMTSFMYYNNSSVNQTPPFGTYDPVNPEDYYNLLSGTWLDGEPLTQGGDGYDPDGEELVKYAYPDNPSDLDGWSMCQENSIEQNRRMVIGIGPSRLAPGATNSMTIAVLFKPSVPHPCPDIGCVEDLSDEIEDFIDSQVPLSAASPIYDPSALRLIPNPMTNQAELILENATQNIQQVQVFSINGKLLRTYNGLSINSLIIEKGNLTPGMYVYKVLTDQQNVYTGKFVVN